MKKKLITIISVALVIVLSLILYKVFKNTEKAYPITEESLQFEKEYEGLNMQDNGNDGLHRVVNLPSNTPVKYTSYDEIFKILEDGSGVIYFGFPECPWCRNIIEPFIESVTEYGLDTIYYLNNREDRNKLSLSKNKKVVTEYKGTDEYLELVKILKDKLPAYTGLNNDEIKRLYFPTILFVKNGEVIGLEQSLKSYSDRVDGDSSLVMNEEEIKELKELYKEYYKKIEE